MGVSTKGRNHTPVGNVVHRIGDAVEEVDQGKEPDKTPAGEPGVESSVNNKRGGQDTNHKPWLVFAPARPGAFDDVAHDWVVQGIKHTGTDHNSRYRTELGGIQPAGKENEGKDKIRKKVVNHVAADCAKREHDQIPFKSFFAFHCREILSKSIFLWYAVYTKYYTIVWCAQQGENAGTLVFFAESGSDCFQFRIDFSLHLCYNPHPLFVRELAII